MAHVVIDVLLHEEILDAQGQAVRRALPELGFDDVVDVRVGKHIQLEIAQDDTADGQPVDEAQLADKVQRLADKLLVNPVIERYTWRVQH